MSATARLKTSRGRSPPAWRRCSSTASATGDVGAAAHLTSRPCLCYTEPAPMKISTKGEYGIRAMLYIGMHADEGPVTSHEIAGRQGIPEPYLRQILALLSKDRLIQSNRGPQGGHILGRPASQITLRQILITLEGQITAVDQIL